MSFTITTHTQAEKSGWMTYHWKIFMYILTFKGWGHREQGIISSSLVDSSCVWIIIFLYHCTNQSMIIGRWYLIKNTMSGKLRQKNKNHLENTYNKSGDLKLHQKRGKVTNLYECTWICVFLYHKQLDISFYIFLYHSLTLCSTSMFK